MMVRMLVSLVSTWRKLVIWEEEISIKNIPLSDWPVGTPMVHFIDWFPVHCGIATTGMVIPVWKKPWKVSQYASLLQASLRDCIRIIWYFELRISCFGQLQQKKQPWLTEIIIFEIRSSGLSSGSAHRIYDLDSPMLAAQLDKVWDSARWYWFWRSEEVMENIWDLVMCPSWGF